MAALSPALIKLNLSFFTDYQQTVAYAWQDRDVYRCGKISRIIDPWTHSCLLTDNPSSQGQRFLLVGDSHADALKRPLADVLDELGHSVRFMKQNTSLGYDYSPEDIVNEVRAHQIKTVILHSTAISTRIEAIKELVAQAEKNNFKVAFIYPVPHYEYHVPKALFFKENSKSYKSPERQTKEFYEAHIGQLNTELSQITSPNFSRYPVVDYFCHPVCDLTDDQNRPLYFDTHHLTLTGAWRLKDLFIQLGN